MPTFHPFGDFESEKRLPVSSGDLVYAFNTAPAGNCYVCQSTLSRNTVFCPKCNTPFCLRCLSKKLFRLYPEKITSGACPHCSETVRWKDVLYYSHRMLVNERMNGMSADEFVQKLNESNAINDVKYFDFE